MAEQAPITRTRRMLEFIAANPGAQLRQIATHIGGDESALQPMRAATLASAILHQQVAKQKVRRTGKPMHYCYWPTSNMLVDLRRFDRNGNARNKGKRQRATKPKPVRAEAPKAPRITTPQPAAPLPKPKLRAPAAPLQTRSVSDDVAAFLARGGKVQKLGAHEASQGLRFDHSQTFLPAKRRPTIRARKAATQ